MVWFKLIIAVQVISALAIMGLVLMQHGKGADMGAAFGAGASGSLFGATGSSNFLSKSTAVAAIIFFVSTLALAYIGYRPTPKATVTDQLETMTVAPQPIQEPLEEQNANKQKGTGFAAVPGVPADKPADKK